MIAWNPKPFIFVHIPKCAGTSIEKSLIPLVSPHRDFCDFSSEERSKFWLPGKLGLQHSKLRGYERQFKLDDYFKFAFVRNPWDRAVSQIGWLRAKTGGAVFSGGTFKENLKIYCATKKNVNGQDLGACQLDYLLDRSGKVGVDFVGRFESLESDFGNAAVRLGLSFIPKLPHIFSSQRQQHYSEFYDAESAGWIDRRFAKDIEFFGYHFESRPASSNAAV